MNADEPAANDFIHQSMVARIATLSRNGRPSITPLYFVHVNGHIWLDTADWTLAAREAKADPRVTVLFQRERSPDDRRILRIVGRAEVRSDVAIVRSNNFRMAFKYVLTPSGIHNYLSNRRLWAANRRYHAQSAEKGLPYIIVVTPEQAEFLDENPLR